MMGAVVVVVAALVPGFGAAAAVRAAIASARACMGVVARDAGVDDDAGEPTTAAPVPPIIASGVFEAS